MDTFHSLMHDYLDGLELAGRSKNTTTAYRHSLVHFGRFLAKHCPRRLDTPEDIRPREITAFYASRRDAGIAPASVGKHHADLRAFFNWCEREEEWTRNPITRVAAPRFEPEPVPLVDPDTTRALVSLTWKSPFFTARNQAIIYVLLDAGVRASELTGMQLAEVDTTHGRIRVTGKGGRVRDVPLGKRALMALRRYLRRRKAFPHAESPYLWIGMKGPIQPKAVNKLLEVACKRAGVPHVKPHAYRHTFGHTALKEGAQEGEVMYIGGWRSRQMLDRYGAAGRAERALAAHARFSPADRL